MKIKTFFVGFFLINVLISSAYPSLARKNDEDAPLIDPNIELKYAFANSPVATEYNNHLMEKESWVYGKYLHQCTEKRTRDCNNEMVEEILQNKHVSKDCCLKIVKARKGCHFALSKMFFELYQVKHFAPKARSKTHKVWNRCSAQIKSPAPFSG